MESFVSLSNLFVMNTVRNRKQGNKFIWENYVKKIDENNKQIKYYFYMGKTKVCLNEL